VDQEDFGHLQACLSGQGIIQSLPACQNARLDIDEDVDAEDVAIFQQCLSGANTLAAPDCANCARSVRQAWVNLSTDSPRSHP